MKKVKIGVMGLWRGSYLLQNFLDAGAEVVAVCDRIRKPELEGELAKAVYYTEFDEFIKHDMDAVFLANYFCEHKQYAVKAMRAGKHVLSETISNVCMADGVELCRVKEETGKIYALLENYPYFCPNLAMQKLYQQGVLGEVVYAEGEYVHPMDAPTQNGYAPFEGHWRNWTPRTYYTTHALAPLMMMTDSMPTRVCAMAAFNPELAKGTALRTGDAAAILLCQTDKNAVFRVTGWSQFAPEQSIYRLCGMKASVETDHHHQDSYRICYQHWTRPEGVEDGRVIKAEWEDAELGELASHAGHGGGDFFSIYHFIKAIENNTEPYWNVYRATAMASVAILGWRSILNGNCSYDIPDFRREEDRRKYEFDRVSPYPDENLIADIPCSSQYYMPTDEDLASARADWAKN